MGTGGGNTPMVMEIYKSSFSTNPSKELANCDYKDTPIVTVEGNGQRPSHKGKGYNEDDVSYTLNTIEQHSVAYGISSKDSNGMKSDNPNVGYYKADTSRTLDLNGGNPACNQGGIAIVDYQNDKTEESNYYVRRLTPIECERLQNMPDNWCYDVSNDSPSQEDINFWDNVFDVYRKVISKGKKQKTKKQIETWIKSPLNDNSIYKIQGNGIALPNAWFVLEGIAKENK